MHRPPIGQTARTTRPPRAPNLEGPAMPAAPPPPVQLGEHLALHQLAGIDLYHGDSIAAMRELATGSVDSIVTDPPYGLGFMGKAWDELPPGLPWAQECLRVLKPGGHLLAFGGARTWHRLAAAVEDAGFEIRDSIAWLYGSGFPKSLDVSKAIDKAAGVKRDPGAPGRYSSRRPQVEVTAVSAYSDGVGDYGSSLVTTPATDAARRWGGWGTALKPAFEPIVVGRKPLVGTVAANVQQHGTGALNIDGCRVGDGSESRARVDEQSQARRYSEAGSTNFAATPGPRGGSSAGRWPANVLLAGDQADALDQQSGTLTSGRLSPANNVKASANNSMSGGNQADRIKRTFGGDTGGASRFFPTFRYQAKAPTSERPNIDGVAHPTVKPVELMRWLCRLVTPPGGTVLDPFAGSGTTGEACLLEGFSAVLVERETDYLPLIAARLARAAQ